VEAGGGNSLMTLDYEIDTEDTKTIDAQPQHDTFGMPGAKIIAPGHPDASVLLHRISIRGTGQMPPLATSRVDEPALKMLREWVASLQPKATDGK
jgi:hypothetical protein